MHARSIIPVLPSALTLGNLVCGFVAMAKVVDATTSSGGSGALDPIFGEKIVEASWLVLLGMVFDALDGRIARMTGQASALGGLLDSLSDVVTFGAAPALIAKAVYEHGKVGLDQPFMPKIITALCAVYLMCAALRLARFTVNTGTDEDSHHMFQGLPSPAAAGFIVSACIFIFEGRHDVGLSPENADILAVMTLRALPIMACVMGLLMVSGVPYVHVVQRYVGHRTRRGTFVRLVLIVAGVLLFREWSLFVVSLGYVVGGIVLAVRARVTGRPVHEDLPEAWAEPDDGSGELPPDPANGNDRNPAP
jgi:CDP-diacylglycerol--serine O-phosphatidyltransferase